MEFIAYLLFAFCQVIILIWFYFWQMHARWGLRAEAFRQAGADAGRRGTYDRVAHEFLKTRKAVMDMIGLTWSANCFRVVNHWTPRIEQGAQDRQLAEQQRDDAEHQKQKHEKAVAVAEERCLHRFGYVPSSVLWYNELFFAGQVLVAICEFPMNSIAMESAGRSENTTLFIAAILSVIFVILAHLIGEKLAEGKTPSVLLILSVGGIFTIAKIREAAIVAYANSVRAADSQGTVDPIYFVLLFCGIQCLLFYLAVHVAAKHYEPVRAGYRRARRAVWQNERLIIRCRASIQHYDAKAAAINNRLTRYAIGWANEFCESQNFFDQRLHVFAEAVEIHRSGPVAEVPQILLNEPPIMSWVRGQLGRPNTTLLPLGVEKEKESVK